MTDILKLIGKQIMIVSRKQSWEVQVIRFINTKDWVQEALDMQHIS